MRRLAWCVAAFSLVAAVLAVPRSVGASGELAAVEVTRYGGADRYETSLLVAEEIARLEGGRLEWVVMVPGNSWTDAVVAAPLAGKLGAPVLVTPSGELRADAARFLDRVEVTNAVLIGADSDTSGIGPGVVAGLEGLGIVVERVTGADQYETSVAVARRMGAPSYLEWSHRGVILASGEVFADALVAGVIAARSPLPILLTPPDRLHPAVAEFLRTASGRFFEDRDPRGVEQVMLMGGTAALADSVQDAVESLRSSNGPLIKTVRVAGNDRFHTAVLAERWTRKIGSYVETPIYRSVSAGRCGAQQRFGLARADVPFDAFSAAPLLARLCAPLLLTPRDRHNTRVASLLDNARGFAEYGWTPPELRIFGGNAAVPHRTVDLYLGTQTASASPTATCDIEPSDKPLPLPDGLAWRPTWSPDCSRIAYGGPSGTLWTARPDGSGAVRLTSGGKIVRGIGIGANDSHPAWSPDGTQIAFARQPRRRVDGEWNKQRHIFVMNADGTDLEQLTFGNVTDDEPSWSPDGTQIAFSRLNLDTPEHRFGNFRDRFIAVMNADGTDVTELTRGGLADADPEWSPDGHRIAYNYGNLDIHIMQASGALPRELPAQGEKSTSGYSWSPDGERFAFAESELIDGEWWNFITITSLDGTQRQRIISLNRSAQSEAWHAYLRNPRWSPDGRYILYEQGLPDIGLRLYITEAAKPLPAKFTRECELPKFEAQVGTHRAAVLFVDFPDAPAVFSTQENSTWRSADGTIRSHFGNTADYAKTMSYGRLNIEFSPLHQWLRLPEPFEHYSRLGNVNNTAAETAIELARPHVDLSNSDSIVLVLPGTRFINGYKSGIRLPEGRGVPLAVINTTRRAGVVDTPYLPFLTHEFMHVLGLGDIYNARRLGTRDTQTVRPRLGPDWSWRLLRVGYMGLSGNYPAPTGSPHNSQRYEMLGWNRWKLGWLDDTHLACVTDLPTTVELAPIANPGERTVLAVIRATPSAHIIIESRRRTGWDIPFRDDIAGDGVLVYVTDPHTVGPFIQLATDNGYGYLRQNPLLAVGDSITIHDHAITVTADNGDTHSITITTNNE
ncbi:cell wall-binding repeat-containing protein [Candidatus Poriferisodalis sp.]|uniref:cell wall-binding repeat-containing protein n=1 Tax=Candidatus Poriferisodalis sp. TaxID=3101277 RepID=UPI003B5B36E1